MKNPEETIGKLIDNASTSFVSYVDEAGFPVTKAMLKPRERNGIREIWFSTNTSSNKVKCFLQNNKASVYFIDKRFFTSRVAAPENKYNVFFLLGNKLYYAVGKPSPTAFGMGVCLVLSYGKGSI